jgi:regulator of replication initiation timing
MSDMQFTNEPFLAQMVLDLSKEVDHLEKQVAALTTAIKAVIEMNHMIAEELGWLK